MESSQLGIFVWGFVFLQRVSIGFSLTGLCSIIFDFFSPAKEEIVEEGKEELV